MQRLELLLMLMLVRHRQPLSETVGSGKRTALGAAVMSLPSGLLVIVGEALTKLESRLKARASVVRSELHAVVAPASTEYSDYN